MNLGDKIKEKRRELNMTQLELARRCGYNSRSAINKIEAGARDIPRDKIPVFCSVLHVPADFFISDDDLIEEINKFNNPSWQSWDPALPDMINAINALLHDLGYKICCGPKGFYIPDLGAVSEGQIQQMIEAAQSGLKTYTAALKTVHDLQGYSI